jgi:hypothetical protein
MDSFLENCLDKGLISRWLVCDDHSSNEDIVEMKRRYPFLEIIKSPGRGQAASINHLFSQVETEWFFHCEDDWLFIKKDNFLQKLFDVAFDDYWIKNVTLRYWTGNLVKSKKTRGLAYNVHQYIPDQYAKAVWEKNDCKWYGYTLNPGLQHKPTVDKLGKYNIEYNINSRFWDRPPAVKYLTLGFKRANLLDKYIEHIGEGNSAYSGD